MKTLKKIIFDFYLSYEMKEITRIQINYRGNITLSFASRKKDLTFSIGASGSEIYPELYSSLDILDRDQYSTVLDILSNNIFLNLIMNYIIKNTYPNNMKGIISIDGDKISYEIDK